MRADSIDSDLGRRKQIEGLLISGVRPLQIIAHEITVAYEGRVVHTGTDYEGGNEQTEGAPHFAIVVLQCNHALEEIDRLSV